MADSPAVGARLEVSPGGTLTHPHGRRISRSSSELDEADSPKVDAVAIRAELEATAPKARDRSGSTFVGAPHWIGPDSVTENSRWN
jgi:hypothetical protein